MTPAASIAVRRATVTLYYVLATLGCGLLMMAGIDGAHEHYAALGANKYALVAAAIGGAVGLLTVLLDLGPGWPKQPYHMKRKAKPRRG